MKRVLLKLNLMLAVMMMLSACGSDGDVIKDPENLPDKDTFIGTVCVGTITDTGFVRYNSKNITWFIDSEKGYEGENRIDGGILYFTESLPQKYQKEGKKVSITGEIYEYRQKGITDLAGWEYYYIKITEIKDLDSEDPVVDYPQQPGNTTSPDSMVINMLPETNLFVLTDEQTALVKKSNDFAFNYYRAVNEANGKGNNITSPMSVSYMLGMLGNGAAGKTADEIKNVLGFGSEDKSSINGFYQTVIEQTPLVDPSVTVQIANIIAANSDVDFESAFKNDMQKYFDAEVTSLDFGKSASLDYLNGWCNEKSGGMIPKIIDELNSTTQMVLMNAVYFKATWTEKFDEKDTRDKSFTTASGKTVKLPMMHRKAEIRYTENDIYSGIALPFGGSWINWNMYILLPSESKTVDDVIASLRNDNWLNRIDVAEVDIEIPRFSIESDIVLNDIVSKMGAPSIFSPSESNLSLISKNKKDLFISLMKQKAAIEVTEEGTKTTAVTIANGATAWPIFEKGEFHVNRPFVYIIQENSSGAIFFIGTFRGE